MSNILTGFNMQGNDPIDDRIVSKSNLETLEQYLKRVPVQKRYYGLTFFALDKNNELRKYTFQTSLINPTIDDYKELQEHVSDKTIHKTSEEIRSEIVDTDIPDTISRVQWTLDQINTAVINLIGGASDEYNTLKRIQTKIEELRAKIYGDDEGTVLNTLEQALKFLNQYKDFIVDIPENFVSKQDIVDNLTTDDPTKVLSAKQGKVLSDTLTNYFESAMQSIRTETDRAINAENRIETKLDKEIDRSTKEDQRIDSKLDSEINRSTTEDDRLDKKIDAETTRATDAESNLNTKIETETDRAESEESRIETKLDNEIARSTNKDTEHDNRLTALEGQTHEQNTDLGTTNSTFQLKYNTGNKIKHESDAISVRNAADTDYVNFIAKNATFKGDLLVEGQSFVTEAETVEIKDNLLLLNKGEVGAGVTKGIAGLEIDRGTEPNYQIIFDESDNRFKAGEIGDIQCLALRDGDNSMVNGMFTSWDSSTKRLKTTNIVPSDQKLSFGDNGDIELKYSLSKMGEIFSSAIPILNIGRKSSGYPHIEFGLSSNQAVVYTDALNGIYLQNQVLGRTFKRATDLSEVLYHADIVNNLTSGGTNKVLSAEQGKLLQNSITSIQGSYLPLSGGNMTGNIVFNNNLFLNWKNSKGSTYQVLSMKSNDEINIGNAAFPLNLYSKEDLFHKRNGENVYRIYDAYNLPDPVTLSGNNTFTGNNTFQAGKFNVSSFEVTSNGSLLSNISSPAGSAWSRNLTFGANSDSTSSFRFGGYNSVDNTSIGYAYIGIGDVTYSTAQYKFYANSLRVPYRWSIDGPDGAAILWSQTSEIVNLGRAAGTTKIRSGNTDLIHTKGSTEYIIWDKSNLPTPATSTDLANYLPLAGGNMTGRIRFPVGFGIVCEDVSGSAAYNVLRTWNSNGSTRMYVGTVNFPTYISSTASDLIHDRNGSSYLLWDSYNLTNPVRYALDASNYPTLLDSNGNSFSYIKAGPRGILPNTSGSLSSEGSGTCGTSGWSFQNGYFANVYTNRIMFSNNTWTNDLAANRNSNGYLQVLDAYNASSAGGPTNYGTVLQVNSRNAHWANQLWFPGGAEANKNLYYRHMAYNETTYGEWNRLLTNKDVNIIQTQSSSNPSTLPANQIFYSEIHNVAGTPTPNGLLFSVQGDDEGIQLWASSTRTKLYYRTKWTSYGEWIKLATTSDIGNYLPLTGGIVTGDIKLNTEAALYTAANSGSGYSYYKTISYDNDKGIILGASNTSIKIQSSDPRIYHIYKDTEYEIYSTNNLPTPVYAPGKVAGSLTPIYNNFFYINDSSYKVATIDNSYSFPKIYSPTSAGTSGQILQSTGGVPKWVAASSIGGNYVSKSGDTMTGKLIAQGGINLNNVGKTGISFYSTSYVTWVEYMTNTGSGLASTGGTSSSYGNVTSWARRSTIEQTSGYGWIWDSCANSSGANPDPKMALSSNNGNLYVKGTITSNGKTVATTDQIPSIPSISISNSGSGNAVTAISASGHTLTVTKGATYLTSHQTIYDLTFQAGTFAAKTFDPNGAAATVNIPTKTSHLTNDSGFITSSATVGSATVPVYMNAGTITQCSTTLGVSITGNAATATNATQLGGTAASSYVKANDNISRLTNDRNYVRSTSTLKVSDIQVLDGGTPGSEAGILYIVLE